MKPLLTVAIPTYHNFQMLSDCLTSLFKYTDFPFKVVVMNNAPQDAGFLSASLEGPNAQFKDKISIINMEHNKGWMGALNIALDSCDTTYFCMLNDDVVFIPGNNLFWRQLIGSFNYGDVGAVAPCSNFVAGNQSLMALDTPDYMETSLLIGMCLVLETEFFKSVGGLDETLPGGDDLDLSIRVLDAGKKLICNRNAYLHHHGQQTGKRVKGDDWDSIAHQERTNNALIRKHGLRKWYRTFCAGWDFPAAGVAWNEGETEDSWLDSNLSCFRDGSFFGLDLGCGDQDKDFSTEGLNIKGIDITRKGETGVGGRKFTKAEPDVTGDVIDLPYRDSSVDYILAAHIFEHLVDPVEAMTEWKRVLKPGGTLLLSVPNQEKNNTQIMDCSHVHVYTPKSLKTLLCLGGWDVPDIKDVGWGVIVSKALSLKGVV